ncbi:MULTISPECIES: LAGLIDADG family homing endonuclease [Gordonia]|uniref:LAGLIDADG family homing endonuclease n=1 Tax=Gordonia TaxID=2053 RepID=UPI00257A0FD1|nr:MULTISPECIES: LAGLIDADG family homing endonuclease [Gordonia]
MKSREVERKGREEPRVFTPPLRELTRETSHGWAAIAFAETVLGVTLFPWQKWLLIHALELDEVSRYRFRTVVVLVARQNGKALDIDTPILTTNGWSTMGELSVGDEVYHPDGHSARVTGAFDATANRECFEVETTDGRRLVADADHLWTVQDRRRCVSKGRRGERQLRTYLWETLTTRQLIERGLMRSKRECAFRLPVQHAILSPDTELPIDPWLLGLWLGDGSSSSALITVGDRDVGEITTLIKGAGAEIVSSKRARTAHEVRFRIAPRKFGFQAQCTRLGVWGTGNKHVPERYLTAGTRQREALLQGLLDSDGSISAAGQVEFSATNRRLADDALYLARSLGWRATLRESRATIAGRDCGPRYRVTFTPSAHDAYRPFRLGRKTSRVRDDLKSRGGERHAVSIRCITPVPSRPVRCIKVDRPDGLFLAGRDLMPTHNTLVMLVLALWHIYALESRTVIGTAQDLANAEKAWDEAVAMARAEPELEELIEDVKLGHPRRFLVRPSSEDDELLTEYRVASASRRGARGFSGDLILLDELREHQSWDSWAAATKTTLARPKAQVWAFSNAGDAVSIVLRYLRTLAHRALDWPDGDGDHDVLTSADSDEDAAEWEDDLGEDTLGLFEWSAAPGLSRRDRDGWAQANPSMGHTDVVENCITERAIAAAVRTDPPHVVEQEVLCRWINTAASGPFPSGAWELTTVHEAAITEDSRRVVCVDVSWNRGRAYIARAGFDATGVPVVDIGADRAGTEWVVGWLADHADRFDGVVIQTNGAPVTSLLVDIESADVDVTVIPWAGPDLGIGFALVYDRLEATVSDPGAPRLQHLPHPGLDRAASTAVPKVLGQGAVVIDRAKSPTDAAPLQAMIGAVWGLWQLPEEPVSSAYEDYDLEFL